MSLQVSSCTSGHVELDLVLDAVQQRRIEAVVAQVHRLHSCCGEGSSHDRDRLWPEMAIGYFERFDRA